MWLVEPKLNQLGHSSKIKGLPGNPAKHPLGGSLRYNHGIFLSSPKAFLFISDSVHWWSPLELQGPRGQLRALKQTPRGGWPRRGLLLKVVFLVRSEVIWNTVSKIIYIFLFKGGEQLRWKNLWSFPPPSCLLPRDFCIRLGPWSSGDRLQRLQSNFHSLRSELQTTELSKASLHQRLPG